MVYSFSTGYPGCPGNKAVKQVFVYSTVVGDQSVAISLSVCLCVSVSVCVRGHTYVHACVCVSVHGKFSAVGVLHAVGPVGVF